MKSSLRHVSLQLFWIFFGFVVEWIRLGPDFYLGLSKIKRRIWQRWKKWSDECLKLETWGLKFEISPPLRPVSFHSRKIAALIENYWSYKFKIWSRRQSIKTHCLIMFQCQMIATWLDSNCPLTRFSTQLLVSFDQRIQLWSQLMLRGSALHKGRK